MRLTGKVALVTGGASGLGQAVARRFAAEGARVAIVDVNEVDGEATAKAIDGLFVRCDVAQAAQVEAAVAATSARLGKLDILYANAAIELIGQDTYAHELSEEVWDRTMAVNLKGVWLSCKYAIAAMLPAGAGSVLIAASPTGLLGVAPDETAYSTSKGGVAGLVRVMAAGYARKGIRVNGIVPGCMDTPINGPFLTSDAVRAQVAESIPIGRIGLPDDIAGLAVFLASDESAYCTGGFFMCDGGLTAV